MPVGSDTSSMRRRTLLAGATAGLALGGGCLGGFGESGCPDPTLSQPVEYEVRTPGSVFELGGEGILLATSEADVDRLTFQGESDDEAAWARNTAFDEYAILATQVGSSGQSSDLQVLGVDREDGTTLHVYTCIAEVGQTDDWRAYARLFRVPVGDQPPTNARLSHWEGGQGELFDGPPEQ